VWGNTPKEMRTEKRYSSVSINQTEEAIYHARKYFTKETPGNKANNCWRFRSRWWSDSYKSSADLEEAPLFALWKDPAGFWQVGPPVLEAPGLWWCRYLLGIQPSKGLDGYAISRVNLTNF
jgi:hypothetical protein